MKTKRLQFFTVIIGFLATVFLVLGCVLIKPAVAIEDPLSSNEIEIGLISSKSINLFDKGLPSEDEYNYSIRQYIIQDGEKVYIEDSAEATVANGVADISNYEGLYELTATSSDARYVISFEKYTIGTFVWNNITDQAKMQKTTGLMGIANDTASKPCEYTNNNDYTRSEVKLYAGGQDSTGPSTVGNYYWFVYSAELKGINTSANLLPALRVFPIHSWTYYQMYDGDTITYNTYSHTTTYGSTAVRYHSNAGTGISWGATNRELKFQISESLYTNATNTTMEGTWFSLFGVSNRSRECNVESVRYYVNMNLTATRDESSVENKGLIDVTTTNTLDFGLGAINDYYVTQYVVRDDGTNNAPVDVTSYYPNLFDNNGVADISNLDGVFRIAASGANGIKILQFEAYTPGVFVYNNLLHLDIGADSFMIAGEKAAYTGSAYLTTKVASADDPVGTYTSGTFVMVNNVINSELVSGSADKIIGIRVFPTHSREYFNLFFNAYEITLTVPFYKPVATDGTSKMVSVNLGYGTNDYGEELGGWWRTNRRVTINADTFDNPDTTTVVSRDTFAVMTSTSLSAYSSSGASVVKIYKGKNADWTTLNGTMMFTLQFALTPKATA